MSAGAAVALLVALVVARPVVAWLAAGLSLAGAFATQSFGPAALLLSWGAAAALVATTAVVGRRGALVVALAAALGAALPSGPIGATAPGALALLPAFAVVSALPAITNAFCRVLQGGPGLLLAAVAAVWLPVGLDGGPWPVQIGHQETLPATLAAAQHVVAVTGTVFAQRPPVLGLLATIWPIGGDRTGGGTAGCLAPCARAVPFAWG